MGAMKGFSMNKVLGSIKKKPASGGGSDGANQTHPPIPENETPVEVAERCVRQFCESGGSHGGDDVTFLPYIVDAAESSPVAAAESARLIRKFLNRDYWTKPSCQYNAIMLIRILSDNPGPTFTRNMDKKFVDVTKELLRSGRDPSVRQMLMETLDSFENTKGYDEGLGLIIEMWKKEKEKAYKAYGNRPQQPPMMMMHPAAPYGGGGPPGPQPEYFARAHNNKRLPNPVELANRLEEARTSAKLLEQVVACTPPSEILQNDLIKEFADRCLSASRSIQGYMAANDPAPDNDTMESLIDTNEQLQNALNQNQRAVLNAKKQMGVNERSNNPSPLQLAPNEQPRRSGGSGSSSSAHKALPVPPPVPPASRKPQGNGKGKATASDLWERDNAIAGPSRSATGTPQRDEEDPFRDPVRPESSASSTRKHDADSVPRLPYEPYHPGGFSASFQPTKTDPVTPVSEDGYENENDAYRVTPKKADPVYRY
ncbi:hypothetical protein B0H63DRAFT_453745 [Podospora didyma]|uniref:GAT domain-containing protein n=1 Tax=Podospora didyma TaxID=330526 RepID=A0AAE0N6E1_9PEZI|nr:hypothetical protein B0H63DRAFT_453745 [Podospora didyma]